METRRASYPQALVLARKKRREYARQPPVVSVYWTGIGCLGLGPGALDWDLGESNVPPGGWAGGRDLKQSRFLGPVVSVYWIGIGSLGLGSEALDWDREPWIGVWERRTCRRAARQYRILYHLLL